VIAFPSVLMADNGAFHFKIHTGFTLSGEISLDQTQELFDLPLYMTIERLQSVSAKLFDYDQFWSIGVLGQYSAVSYETGGVVRRGFHQSFGIRGAWVLSKGAWLFKTNLDLIPVTMISVFSSVESLVNGDRINSTGQTDLFGFGYRLGQSINYRMSLNFFSMDHVFLLGATASKLQENFNKRRDFVIQVNKATGTRDVSDNVRSCSCSAEQTEMTFHLGYQL